MFLANFFDLRHEQRQLVNYFDLVDTDNNGELSFRELCECYGFKVNA